MTYTREPDSAAERAKATLAAGGGASRIAATQVLGRGGASGSASSSSSSSSVPRRDIADSRGKDGLGPTLLPSSGSHAGVAVRPLRAPPSSALRTTDQLSGDLLAASPSAPDVRLPSYRADLPGPRGLTP